MTTSRQRSGAETRLMKALSHPLRYRILARLNESPASPSTLARELGEPLGNVSYHVKILLEHETIELVETRPVRGALEHTYRALTKPYLDKAQWSELPESVRQQFHEASLQTLWEDAVAASEAGGFSDPDTHVSVTALDLDRQGYGEVVELLGKTLDRALEIHAESANRNADRPEDERESEQTELAILHFRRASRD